MPWRQEPIEHVSLAAITKAIIRVSYHATYVTATHYTGIHSSHDFNKMRGSQDNQRPVMASQETYTILYLNRVVPYSKVEDL